jgi:hypothetical protein
MITAEQRARRSWMLSFADIVTLLIAFFGNFSISRGMVCNY